MGRCLYARTAWNRATLQIQFDRDLFGYTTSEVVMLQLKFSRSRNRIEGTKIWGYFNLR